MLHTNLAKYRIVAFCQTVQSMPSASSLAFWFKGKNEIQSTEHVEKGKTVICEWVCTYASECSLLLFLTLPFINQEVGGMS